MPPEAVLFILLLLAVIAAPLVLLGFTIAIFKRQRQNHEELSDRLRRVERDVTQTQRLVRDLAGETRKAESPPAPAAAPVEAPKPIVPEVVAEAPALRPLSTVRDDRPAPPRRVPQAPPAVREPSRFEAAARDILRKIWNWIIVGEEHVPEGMPMEFAIAGVWLLRVGVLLLVVGAGFFVNYSIQNGYINEFGRVAICAAAGLGLLAAGTQMLGRKYHLFGQGLMGAGIAMLYLSVFGAASRYHLIGMPAAFGLMIAVTCLAGWIAVRFDSMLVAVLGILGGYGTPVMLSTGEVNFVGLFSYLLILGAGVFGISYKKNWRLLNYLSFAGTYALFFAALQDYRTSDFWQVMPFLAAFFALYSTMTFLFNLVNRQKSTLLEVLGLLINAGAFFGASYWLVEDAYGRKWVAAVSLALAACYAAHVYYFLIRRLLDREMLLAFTALSAFFLAVTIPLALSSEWITASWALQALVMLWIAGKLESEFLRQIAYLLYAFVLVRFGAVDLRQQYFAAAAADLPMVDYLWQMLERVVMLGIPIGSLAGAGWLLRRTPPKPLLPVGDGNDVRPWIGRHWAVGAVVAVVAGMMFLALHCELDRSLLYFYPPLRLPVLSLLWIAMCAFLLGEYRRNASNPLLVLLAAFVVGLVLKLFCFDIATWHVHLYGIVRYDGLDYSFLDGAMRLLDFGAIVAFLGCAYYLLPRNDNARPVGAIFGSAAVALLWVWSTLEVNTFLYHYVPGLRAGGVSILWSVFALSLIVAGIWRDARAIRYVGLALFAVVAWKVFFSDLARLDQLYRIVAFLLLGVLVLSGSFVYLKYRPALTAAAKKEDES